MWYAMRGAALLAVVSLMPSAQAFASVLVTGGAGYIGSHTCVELILAGEQVSCRSRRETNTSIPSMTAPVHSALCNCCVLLLRHSVVCQYNTLPDVVALAAFSC
jgi:nucleoside-diphosphate-sugar epimerase